MSAMNENHEGKIALAKQQINHLTDTYLVDMKAIEAKGNARINTVKESYRKKIEEERGSDKPSKSKIKKLEKEAHLEIQNAVRLTTEEGVVIAQVYGDEVLSICKENQLALPEQQSVVMNFVDSNLYEKADKDISMSVTDRISWATFFLLTPLGMVLIEDFFLGGLLLTIGAVLHLPPLLKKILKSNPWLSPFTLVLISHVLIIAGLVKTIHFS